MGDTATDLDQVLTRLAHLDVDTLTPAGQIDLLTACERLKGAAAACQARTTVAFAAHERAAGHDQGVAAQVGLAMRTSPAKARRFVGFAHALDELPHTRTALTAGETSEYRAYLIVKETAFVSLDHRRAVDTELAQQPGGIGALGDRTAEARARTIAQRLDPASAVRRHSDAVKQRRVSLRPAPDGMSRLSAVLPLTDAVATYNTLHQAAETARAVGDPRTRGEVMADELVTRLLDDTTRSPGGSREGRCATSSTTQDDPPEPQQPVAERPVVEERRSPVTRPPAHQPHQHDVEVCLVMTDATLLGSDDPDAHHEPAQVTSATGTHGTIPADTARGLVRDAARVWIRRLYTDPRTGDLVAMDKHRRLFDTGLRRFLVLRDQQCRTPWCDAPIRHADHITPHADGGPTSARNGQGLCEACNHAKHPARLTQSAVLDGSVRTLTPTGHTYVSHRPRPPGPPPRPRIDWTTAELWLRSQPPA